MIGYSHTCDVTLPQSVRVSKISPSHQSAGSDVNTALSLVPTRHHAMQVYGGVEAELHTFLNPDTRCG
jgi:hypothetical protein